MRSELRHLRPSRKPKPRPGHRSGARKRRERGRAAHKPRCVTLVPVTVYSDGSPYETTMMCGQVMTARRGWRSCPVGHPAR